MSKKRVFLPIVLLFLVISGNLFAQTPQTGMPEEMKKITTPGPGHELLKYFIGSWSVEATFFMSPKNQPLKGTGTMKAKSILGGRFIQAEATSVGFGMKNNSMSFLGHDNRTGDYTYYGMDELGTYAINAFGAYDEKNKTYKFTGQELDPYSMEPMGFRLVYKIESDDKFTLDLLFETPDGQEFKSMTATYTREKE